MILYFLAVHGVRGRGFPKELIVGAIFACGAMIPAWTHTAESKALVPTGLLFCGLCGLNCIAIECWEHNRGERRWEKTPYWLIRLADTRIVLIAAILIAFAGLIGVFGSHTAGQSELLAASGISLSIFAAIQWQSNSLSPQALRVLADAALLTPTFFLLRLGL